jgi:hypothetical protein
VALTVSALTLMAVQRPVAEASDDIPPVSVVYFEFVGPAGVGAEGFEATPAAEAPSGEQAGLEAAARLLLPAAAEAAIAFSTAEGEPAARPAPLAVIALDSHERHLAEVTAADRRILDPDHTQRLHAFGLPSLADGIEAPEAAPAAEAATVFALEPSATEGSFVEPAPAPPAAIVGADVHRVFPGIAILRSISNVNITFYDCADQGFCGNMANGRKVYQGAAACSYDLPFGTRFYIEDDPTGRIYRCEDRGLLSNTWVDIFWYFPADGWRWQEVVGRRATIHIIEWGTADD